MSRQLSGFKPTGHLQLGNLLGAIRPMVAGQRDHESIVLVVDLHAMTVDHDPDRLRELTVETATLLLAAGVDPARSLFYVQSQVPEHTELHYLLECVTSYGEAHRMIQFKEKAATQQQVRLSLLTYPTLMAADILLHDVDEVPVGADQSQHVELARDVAVRPVRADVRRTESREPRLHQASQRTVRPLREDGQVQRQRGRGALSARLCGGGATKGVPGRHGLRSGGRL